MNNIDTGDLVKLLLRLGAAWIFIVEGYLKLFVVERIAMGNYFGGLGFPFPEITGLFVGFLEFFGGILLLFGFLTRITALLFTVEMFVATLVANLPTGFGAAIEVSTLLFMVNLSVIALGSGKISIDRLLHRKSAIKI